MLIQFFTNILANSIGIKYCSQVLNLKDMLEFSTVEECKANTKKSVAFLYTTEII